MVSAEAAGRLAMIGLLDILVFFGVLLVGFAYVWHRGDLDWVRAMVAHAKQAAARSTAHPLVETKSAAELKPEPQHV